MAKNANAVAANEVVEVAAVNVEKAMRKFLRATFGCRIKKVDGEFQSEVKKNSAKVELQNAASVLQTLRDMKEAKLTTETDTKAVFTVKGQGTVSIAFTDEGNFLTLVKAKA